MIPPAGSLRDHICGVQFKFTFWSTCAATIGVVLFYVDGQSEMMLAWNISVPLLLTIERGVHVGFRAGPTLVLMLIVNL